MARVSYLSEKEKKKLTGVSYVSDQPTGVSYLEDAPKKDVPRKTIEPIQPPVKQRTPEEVRASKEAGSAFVRRREKLKSKGLSQREATAQTETELGDVDYGRTTIAETQAERERISGELEEAGTFEEVTPTEVPLAPRTNVVGELPIVGPAGGAVAESLMANAALKGWLSDVIPSKILTGEAAFPITEGTLREAALRQISINAYNEGITNGETFGAIVEAIPVVGPLVSRYVGGLVEAPYANSKEVMAEIEKIATTATNNQEKTRSGIMPASFAMNRAREMEERIALLEGRLKLLINTSAILRSNTDEINKLMQAILDAKIRTDNFRTAASFALTAEQTGTGRLIPTDEQMYFELKEYNE